MTTHHFQVRPEFAGTGWFERSPNERTDLQKRLWYYRPTPLPAWVPEAVPPASLEVARAALARLADQAPRPHADPEPLPADLAGLVDFLLEAHREVAIDSKIHGKVGILRNGYNMIRRFDNELASIMHASPNFRNIEELLAALLDFIHRQDDIDPLAKAIMVNVQLIAIQPFDDGNGRVAAKLMELLLRAWGVVFTVDFDLRRGEQAASVELFHSLQNLLTWGDWRGYFTLMLQAIARAADLAAEPGSAE